MALDLSGAVVSGKYGENNEFHGEDLTDMIEKGIVEEVLPLVSSKMNKGGVILCECGDSETLPEESGDFVLDRTYRYGKIKVSLYRHREML